ncbi:conserved phage C-terminal domain-containing protein [Brochothrix thermosphacta]|uniref:conserved phage C-terminal domain-containing protein n=1 Tax=Brochothrix thermosphacta TaxID=2756 RepID=UPI0039B0BBFF
MAQRRMFSEKIIKSARFIKMPSSTQALYFHLGMNADDDGVVEGFMVMRLVGATEDDLKILVAKGFVILLNEELVTYISDWQEHNKIRADRKVDSIYKDLLLQVLPEVEFIKKKQRADSKKYIEQPTDDQWTTNGQPNVGIGKVRLGKDRLVEVSKDIVPQSETVPPYKTIIDYLNDKAGTKYRSSSKDTQKHIKARFNNGFTLEDFKTVIDNKVFEWGNNSKMSVYLRPKTLFGTKFEDYLNQKGGGESAIFTEDVNKFSNAPVTDDDTLPF